MIQGMHSAEVRVLLILKVLRGIKETKQEGVVVSGRCWDNIREGF